VAVRHQLLSVVSLLLSHGAHVNAVSRYDRRTPLHVAATTGHAAVVRLLADNGASVDQVDVYGSTPLHLAVVGGRLDAARALIDARCDVNAFDNDGWTAVHLAAELGQLALVRLLVASKAHVECQTKFGRTPLHWACCRGHIQVTSLWSPYRIGQTIKCFHPVSFFLSSFFFSSPNLSGRRLDVYHALAHGVALVRI